MPEKQWFIHIQGENFGPVSTKVMGLMLKQGRLQITDFVWTEGFPKWTRLADVEEFLEFSSSYPSIPVPSGPSGAKGKKPPALDEEEESPKLPERESTSKAKTKEPPAPPPPPAEEAPKPKRVVQIKRHERVALEGTVQIPKLGEFPVLNISMGGLFAKAKECPPVGDEVKFKLSSKAFGKTLEMTGLVVREGDVNGEKGFAIDFTRVNPAHLRVLNEYISKTLEPAGQ